MSFEEINQGLRYITYGLYIVTASDGEKQNGMIVNTVFQVTAQPPCVAISVNKNAFTHGLILSSGRFAAMPLDEEAPFVFIGRWGFRSGKTFNKLDGIHFQTGALGCPLIKENTLSFMEAEVVKTVDMGSHTLFIGEVKDAGVFAPQARAMTYAYYHHVLKGKTPAGATHQD